ncbi:MULTISPECIES: discoidin domain-containing protein [unclassified Lentimicrobium]|uniref:discoidin domain-containing protein n=1 Tax=unclassified Lentimicrobium TaxID=2677434 RepID=UPI001552C552|nr:MULTISPECIES: discoidin domain-containing protein [unclassified Lentimicrobium]NPD44625.1 T9SS type A sorting domain-containing protein [Lentimicrobium sp. S6]NPD83337.1 T9SS type A sorting domain-containing protein [Lentimicrobium sp. L6]
MKKQIHYSLAVLIILISFNLKAQDHYTIYDDYPGMIKTYKPAYQDEYPEWAKMLYQEPVNYNEVLKAYSDYLQNNEVAKSPILRYFKIWKRNIEAFVLEDGYIQIPDLKKYQENLLETQVASITHAYKTNSNWSFLGPKETFWLNENGSSTAPSSCPWQVNVYCFDVSASNPEILYCGTETGFVNKSIDNGLTWEQIGLNYVFGSGISALSIDPENEEIVYVCAESQVHKTVDGGLTWIPLLGQDEYFHTNNMEIDPNNPEKLILGTSNGIVISNDGGESFENVFYGPNVYDVQIKTDDSNVIYAISWNNWNFAILKSTDAGGSFDYDSQFPSGINDASGGLLASSPANPDLLLAILLSTDNTPYLYQSDMSIGDWSLLAEGNTSQLPMNNGQGFFDLVLEISPIDESLIFVGTTTLYKSSNSGGQFHAIGGYTGSFQIHPDIQDMKLLSDGNTWLATDGGMTFTTDNFTSTNNYFSRTNGIIGSDMWGFHQGWNEDLIVGGRYHNGNTAMADFYNDKSLRMGGAESPTGWIMPGKSRHAAFNDLGNGWILPETAEGKPEGRFIFSKYPNMDEYGGRRGNIVFHPNYYGTVFLGEGNAFWKSIDGGITFDMLHDFGGRVKFLDISYSNAHVIYADVVGQGLYRSSDDGYSWESKPSLTSGDYGNSYWRGKTHFAISPMNENTIYACLSNGTWTEDIGQVFRSTDGGDTWMDWTGDLDTYTKCLVIQPDENLQDIVYLFTNAENGQAARVFKRGEDEDTWTEFDTGYPSGMNVNYAMPFYRDAKLRVGGSGGVWESPMEQEEMAILVNPWIEKKFYNCMLDTLFFNDHSIMNHDGASWHWEISPEPLFIEDANLRNPKVILGDTGYYSVSLSVIKDGQEYNKTITDMVWAGACSSIENCDNPAELPKGDWEVFYVDSEEENYPGLASMSIDGDPSTIWHTEWSSGSDPYPHEMIVDFGSAYQLFNFTYLPRQDGENGRIKDYTLYISDNGYEWHEMSNSSFENSAAPQTVVFEESINGRFFKLVAHSEVNGNEWASAAEFSLVGCTELLGISNMESINDLKAFPIPITNLVNINLPNMQINEYEVVSLSGQVLISNALRTQNKNLTIDMEGFQTGAYIIRLISPNGFIFRVKVIKN